MRYSDRPISNPAEDALGRSEFAMALARSIDQLTVVNDGFVIGLIGEWGAGKSSVVELTLRYLVHGDMIRAEKGNSPTFQDLEDMADRFSKVEPVTEALLESKLNVDLWERNHRDLEFLKACGSQADADLALKYWRLKREIGNNPRNLVVRFSPWLFPGKAELASALISDLARAVGEKLGSEVHQAFSAVLGRISQAAPIVGAAADVLSGQAFGGLFSSGMGVADQLAKKLTMGPTLESARHKLRLALARADGKKIIVVIDDLDRLTPAEAVEMVSLLKGLGDLPNIVYVLCYDEMRLSELIRTELQLDGAEYLQKIVQYPVHLPPLDPTDISRLLENDLEQIVPELEEAEVRRLRTAWVLVLRHYLRTPRDVRRLINAYSMASAGLVGYTDPIDLLILETIRIYEPSIYNWVRQNITQLAR